MTGENTVAVWVPDWPAVAAMLCADIPAYVPVAVVGPRVVVASSQARAAGVQVGMRRRVAQSLCPELVLLPADDARDVREFEPVAAAVETVVSGLEVCRPGVILAPANGPVRYHGGTEELASALVEAVAAAGFECHVGIARGLLAAILSARESVTVPAEETRQFLATRPVSDVLHAATDSAMTTAVRQAIDLWLRLGIRTLGDVTALPHESVAARFGDIGSWVWRLASGQDLRPPARRRVEPDLATGQELDPPVERVDAATFAARRLAEELHDMLTTRGMSAGRLRITARTENAELERVWRTDDAMVGGLGAARITDRVRWQLEGWLTARTCEGEEEGPGALTYLALAAEEVIPAGTHQPSLWGAGAGGNERAQRSLGRVQGLLGADGVLLPELQGGRTPRDRVHLVPSGEHVPAERDPGCPWPGALPDPAPSCVFPEPIPAQVCDARGQPVDVGDGLFLSADPVVVGYQHSSMPMTHWPVLNWAGPWPHRHATYVQLHSENMGLLMAHGPHGWQVEALCG
jgi:protein ImuB